MNNIKINELTIDSELAYFIGVLHSDGCIYIFNDKKQNKKKIRLSLGVAQRSLPMAITFQRILFEKFNKKVNVRKVPNKNLYSIQTSINRVANIFQNWNSNLPETIKSNKSLFGAYLAGLIDGDGTIHLKNNKDRKLKQLRIEICGPEKLIEVKLLIERYTKSKVHFVKYRNRNCYDTAFYVTYKNLIFLEENVFPHIMLTYKKDKFILHTERLKASLQGFEP